MRRALPGVVLALATVFLLRQALLEGAVFYKRDIHLVWHPQIEAFVRAVLGGAWPVWAPSLAFGRPLWADPSAQIAYPPTWLNLLMRPWTYYTVFGALHLFGSGLGLLLLARHWRFSRGAATVAALLWMGGGPFFSMLDLYHHFAGAAWIPWIVLAADRALGSGRPRDAAAWGLAAAAQALAGSFDMCAMTALAVALLGALRHVRWREGFAESNRACLRTTALAASLALALSAAAWVPALDVLSRSPRLNLPSQIRTYWSVHPLGLAEMVLPAIWSGAPLTAGMRDALFEGREPFLASLYLGGPALVLAAAGLTGGGVLRRWLILLGAAAVLAALGRHLPGYAIVSTVFPPLAILRYPVKAMILVGFAWSLLAGRGFDQLLTAAGRRTAAGLAAAAATAAVLLQGSAALALHLRPEAWRGMLELGDPLADGWRAAVAARLAIAAAVTAAAAGLAVWIRSRPAQAVVGALGLLAAVELAVYHRNLHPVAPRALYTHRPELVARLREVPGARVHVYDYTPAGTSLRRLGREGAYVLARAPEGWDHGAALALAMQMYLMPESAGRWDLSAAFELDYRGLFPTYQSALTHAVRALEGTTAHLRLLQIGGVSHLVALHEQGFSALQPDVTLPGLFADPIRVFRVPAPRPRAYAVSRARPAGDTEALEILLDPLFDPEREIVVAVPPRDVRADPPSAAPVPPPGVARISDERADRVTVRAELDRPGYVVLLDAYDPGWRATIDGEPAELLRANLAFRAVSVPPGAHTVQFLYRPPALLAGLGLSAAALLGVAVGSVRRGPG